MKAQRMDLFLKNSFGQIHLTGLGSDLQMGQGRHRGGNSPGETLRWEASGQVEAKVFFLGELALENCLSFCGMGH